MPLLDRETTTTTPAFGTRPTARVTQQNQAEPSTGDVFGAAFRTENTIGSIFADETPLTGRRDIDPAYDPFANISGYELQSDNFVDASSDEEVELIKKQIDRETTDRQLIESAGATGVIATLAAGVFDPINLIPVGGAATKAYSVGGSVLKGAANTARAGIIGASVAEAALHSTQETRTLGESVGNVAGAALLAGVIGGAAGTIGAKNMRGLGKRVEDDMVVPHPDEPDFAEPNSIVVGRESIGAAAVRDTTLEQEALANAWGVEKAAAAVGLNPKIRAATSPSVETRRFMQEIAETPFYYEKNAEGIASPVALESIVDLQNAKVGKALEQQKPLFRDYKKRVSTEGGDKLNYTQFREQVSKALRRNDTHEIPEVQELARVYRKEVLNPMKEAAIKAGLLDEGVDVKTADSYLHRWWDKEVIARRRPELKKILHNGLRSLPEINTKDGMALDDDELLDIADDIIDKLLGHTDARLPYDLPLATRGPLKERTLNFIRDEDVESFLVNDIEAIAHKYVRTIAPDVAIKDWFGTLDIVGNDGFITTKIRDDYRGLLAKAKTEKETKALNKRMKDDINDIEAVVNQMRGTYGVPENPDSTIVRVARATRQIQYASKLGGMTASAFADVARPVMAHGFGRVFKDAVVPLMKGLKGLKMSAREVKEAGAAWDMVMDSRAMTLAEVNNPYVRGNKFEKGLDFATAGFGKVTLMTQWNTALKQFSGVITQGRVIDSVHKTVTGKVSKKNARYLNMIGIDANMARRISKQLNDHGSDVDGVAVANTAAWKDIEAQTAYRAALKKEVDRIIVTPGAGDLPLVLKGTEAGKMIGQFRSFSFASTNKTLISGLQEADAQTMSGWALAVGMGMVTYAFKTWDRGGELSDDPATWVLEGVDRSGILGVLSEINQLSGKMTRGTVSLQALAGKPPLTRYASANVMGVLAGPTVGTVKDVAQVTGAASTGEWTPSDSRAMRRMIPYQNLFLARQLFDKMEKGINDSLGVR